MLPYPCLGGSTGVWSVVTFILKPFANPITLETQCQVVGNKFHGDQCLMSGVFILFSQITIFEKTELLPVETVVSSFFPHI